MGPPTMVKVLSSGVGGGGGSHGKPTKEELLQMMERVDRDIAATEGQIAVLQKKQVMGYPGLHAGFLDIGGGTFEQFAHPPKGCPE